MKRNNNRVMMVLLAVLLVISLVACGTSTNETMAPVAEETANATVAPTATEEPTKEVDPNATYVEVNELEYEENTEVTTNGVLYVGNNIETLDVINVNWKLTNVVMEDVEDGTKQLTIEQSIGGYIWTDGNIFATNLNVPVARLANAYDGQMIAVGDEDAVETELKWKDDTYTVSAVETTSWEDDDWNDGWYSDPDGDGERLNSRLIVKTVVTINEDYDGLVLVLTPIVDANGSVDGDFIMDVWTKDSKLFNVNDMSTHFVADADAEEVEETETDETEVAESAEETVKEETKTEDTKPAATTVPKEDAKPVHTHSYTSVVSVQQNCTTNGVKTYTCSGCGDSYTESLGYGSHDYSIPVYSTVHHDAQYQTIKRELPEQKIIVCCCGSEFSSQADFDSHRVANIEANGPFCLCGGSFDVEYRSGGVTYDYVEVSPAYDSEEVVAYKCSICGQQR